MLTITNLDKLKIKRIAEYKIYFEYDGESYFIKTMDDQFDSYYDDIVLFKRKFDKERIAEVEWLDTADVSVNENIYSIIQDIKQKAYPFKKGNMVYKFIDKEKFVDVLQSYKLIEYNKQQ